MTPTPEQKSREEAKKSLVRMQEFDTSTLVREADLGRTMHFKDAVDPAQRLVDLYQRLSIAALDDFPQDKLNQLRSVADQDFSLFSQVLSFSLEQANPQQVRNSHIQQIISAYPNTFNTLHPLIAYSLHRSADFQRLDRDARATFKAVQDRASELTEQLEQRLADAERIVEDVRKVAAETGVSQQATYFREESQYHSDEAERWRERTIHLAWGLGIYAVASIFVTRIPFLAPSNNYDNLQLAISKVLIFAVITYMLYLSARNFMSHKHNAIVNKHRQNALLTYRAIADAASDAENREVILAHASACIFGPQPTGYSEDGGSDAARATSVVEVLGKQISGP